MASVHTATDIRHAPARAGSGLPLPGPGAEGAEGRAPWELTENLSTAGQGRRRDRLKVRLGLSKVTRVPRLAKCGRDVMGTEVAVKMSPGNVAYVAGVMRCGLLWLCPVCSAKIRNERATMIAEAAGRWVRHPLRGISSPDTSLASEPLQPSTLLASEVDQAAGNSVYMVTFTAPHDMGMRLPDLLVLIAGAFSKTISGRPWRRVKAQAGIVGTIRSLEVTHGPHGWHPHLHVLVFCEGDPGAAGLAAMVGHFQGRWRKVITDAGYRPPSDQHGVRVQRCESAAEAGLYISKTQDGASVGNELARGDMKSGQGGHRTPFEIAADLADASIDAPARDANLRLWHEYEAAMAGHQAITWSKGLKALLAVEERTDTEIVEAEEEGEVLVLIAREDWRVVMANPGLEADILESAEAGGAWAVIGLLADYGIRPAMGDTG